MKKLIQTRLHNPPEQLGNCYPTVIACTLGLNSSEDAIQIQEYYKNENWSNILDSWLLEKGWKIEHHNEHLFDNEHYFVIGKSERGATHICIYLNGELYHDPHPSQKGLVVEERFERIVEKVIK